MNRLDETTTEISLYNAQQHSCWGAYPFLPCRPIQILLQTVQIQMRQLVTSCLMRIYTVCQPIIDFYSNAYLQQWMCPKSEMEENSPFEFDNFTLNLKFRVVNVNYSRLSLSRIPRDSLKHFEISIPRYIRVERVRKTIN